MLILFQGVRLLGLWLAVLSRVNCRCLVPNLLVSHLDKINSRLKLEEGQSAVLSLQKKICLGIRQSQAAVPTGTYNTSLIFHWLRTSFLLIVSWLSKGRSACVYVCQPEDRKEGCGRQCSSSLGAGMAFCLLEGREQWLGSCQPCSSVRSSAALHCAAWASQHGHVNENLIVNEKSPNPRSVDGVWRIPMKPRDHLGLLGLIFSWDCFVAWLQVCLLSHVSSVWYRKEAMKNMDGSNFFLVKIFVAITWSCRDNNPLLVCSEPESLQKASEGWGVWKPWAKSAAAVTGTVQVSVRREVTVWPLGLEHLRPNSLW